MRPDWDTYYLNIAKAVSERSTCTRRQYGAIIVNRYNRIVSTGFNGAPCGEPNCCDTGICWRAENNIPHGQQYEACQSVHAEQNAINFAPHQEMLGSTIYIFGSEDGKPIKVAPCANCLKSIKNTHIVRTVCGTVGSEQHEPG